MANRATPGPPPKDPLQEIRQSVVAIGTLVDPPPLPRGQLFYDGSQVNFEVRGTGFIYSYTPLAFAKGKSDPDPKTGTVYYWAQLWIVTCQHCVQETPAVAVRIDTKDGTRVFTIRAFKWWMHPDQDLVVTPFGLDTDVEPIPDKAADEAFRALVISTVGSEHTATRAQIRSIGFWESTPVLMIGFPAGMIEGGRKNYPVVRAGTIAQMQGYLEGDPEHRAFLIDGSVFVGNSGGPIVVRRGTMNSENQALSHTVLIGMVSQAVQVETIRDDESLSGVMENADLVNAVTVDSVNETIDSHYMLQRILENASRQPQPLRNHLLDMARLDRSARAALAASGTLFNNGYVPRMARIHQRNAQHLWRIIESVGWPGADLVGSDGAEAAWLILQHAISEPNLLRRALPLITTAARDRKADPAHAAMLEDRIRFFEGRPQRYGTQLDWDADGSLSPGEVVDPQRLAERRDAVGLPPLEEQIEAARSRATAEGQQPPADHQAYEDSRNDWASKAGWRAGL